MTVGLELDVQIHDPIMSIGGIQVKTVMKRSRQLMRIAILDLKIRKIHVTRCKFEVVKV